MLKFKLWDGESSIMLPDGTVLNKAEILKEFPLSATHPMILGYLDDAMTIVGDIDCLGVARSINNIDAALSDTAAVAAIEEIRNAPSPEVSENQRSLTKADMQLLEQHLTEVELVILEAQNV